MTVLRWIKWDPIFNLIFIKASAVKAYGAHWKPLSNERSHSSLSPVPNGTRLRGRENTLSDGFDDGLSVFELPADSRRHRGFLVSDVPAFPSQLALGQACRNASGLRNLPKRH